MATVHLSPLHISLERYGQLLLFFAVGGSAPLLLAFVRTEVFEITVGSSWRVSQTSGAATRDDDISTSTEAEILTVSLTLKGDPTV